MLNARGIALFAIAVAVVAAAALPGRGIDAQIAVTRNSNYVAGVNSIVVQGNGSAADVIAAVEQDSAMRARALWMLLSGSWQYSLPEVPRVSTLTTIPQTGAAYVVLEDRQQPRVIGTADFGGTVTLRVGQEFSVDPDRAYIWGATVDDTRLVESLPTIAIFPPVPPHFRALAPGETTLRITRQLRCRYDTPRCAAPDEQYTVRLIILP
jgi:hypothetical protein